MSEKHLCKICGEPMPEGEEMFKYHGYSCDCPKPSKKTDEQSESARNVSYASPPSRGVQNGGRWTKIEDEEPPEMGTYIVFNGRNVTTANWDKYGFYKVSPGGSYKVNVEQWMSLPGAP